MDPALLRDRIVAKALEFGADEAGVCLAQDLLNGPTHRGAALPEGVEDHHRILVLGLKHPADQPYLDYFIKKDGFRFGNSEGNKRLIKISDQVGWWLSEDGITSRDLHYYVERGGVFLKGAAVLAGLGCIGKNNLFISPAYGARIRLRAHLIEAPLAPSEPLEFDPCAECAKTCLEVCPEGALDESGYDTERCQVRLNRDFDEGILIPSSVDRPAARQAHCCRVCEFACIYKGSRENRI